MARELNRPDSRGGAPRPSATGRCRESEEVLARATLETVPPEEGTRADPADELASLVEDGRHVVGSVPGDASAQPLSGALLEGDASLADDRGGGGRPLPGGRRRRGRLAKESARHVARIGGLEERPALAAETLERRRRDPLLDPETRRDDGRRRDAPLLEGQRRALGETHVHGVLAEDERLDARPVALGPGRETERHRDRPVIDGPERREPAPLEERARRARPGKGPLEEEQAAPSPDSHLALLGRVVRRALELDGLVPRLDQDAGRPPGRELEAEAPRAHRLLAALEVAEDVPQVDGRELERDGGAADGALHGEEAVNPRVGELDLLLLDLARAGRHGETLRRDAQANVRAAPDRLEARAEPGAEVHVRRPESLPLDVAEARLAHRDTPVGGLVERERLEVDLARRDRDDRVEDAPLELGSRDVELRARDVVEREERVAKGKRRRDARDEVSPIARE